MDALGYDATDEKTIPITFRHEHSFTFEEFEVTVRNFLKDAIGTPLIIVDYLELLHLPTGENRLTYRSEMITKFKNFAHVNNISVIILSQLTRSEPAELYSSLFAAGDVVIKLAIEDNSLTALLQKNRFGDAGDTLSVSLESSSL